MKSGDLKGSSAQSRRYPDHWKPNQCGGIVRFDALEQTDPQSFNFKSTSRVHGALARDVALDFFVGQFSEMNCRDVQVAFVGSRIGVHDMDRCVKRQSLAAE